MSTSASPKPRAMAALPGVIYRDFLSTIHAAHRPNLYLEIGIGSGASLARATCRSIAVDPNFRLATDVVSNKPECQFFRQSSDDFFKTCAQREVFHQPIDLAFLDGLHWFEVLLRDFINTERLCAPTGLILLHDCLPYSVEVAERVHRPQARRDQRHRLHWAGDVWKVIPILRKYRPDLRIVSFDCPPTGLVICSGLQPRSRVLEEAYDQIVSEYNDLSLEDFTIQRLFAMADIRSSRDVKTSEEFAPALASA